MSEAEFLEDFERTHAAATGLAVDEGGLRFVELAKLGLEVAGHEVDVLGTFDVAVFELVRSAHIDDEGFAFGDDLAGFVGFDVLRLISGECEGGKEEQEGGEEVFHEVAEEQWTSTGMRERRW